jgi:deoxycytidylate deaminase
VGTLDRLNYPEAELVFGLVAAVGTDLGRFYRDLENQLDEHGYEAEEVHLSRLLRSYSPRLPTEPEYRRISEHMTAGTNLRKKKRSGSVLALLAAAKIASGRPSNSAGLPQPVARKAYVLNSLKHPEEVAALRKIYGSGFFLIGVYDREEDRLSYLVNALQMSRSEASQLIERDQDEKGEIFGQRTRDTFHLADVFVRFRAEDLPNKELGRFLDLVFGGPFHTPTSDEQAMFLAFSSALRSADLSRQVGAVIVSKDGDVLAVGANDVPKAGGGLYWPHENDQRDYVLGFDSNEMVKAQLAKDVLGIVSKGKRLNRGVIAKASRLLAITEFGRAAHAEMEAIIACARNSGNTKGATLYSTTFPCHNCAKHIVTAGIARVVYVEPYPKSRALELHHDSISLDGHEKNKVAFEPFVGIGPRRYFDLFSLSLGSGREIERKKDGRKKDWDRTVPRIQMAPVAYIAREKLAASEVKKMGISKHQKTARVTP